MLQRVMRITTALTFLVGLPLYAYAFQDNLIKLSEGTPIQVVTVEQVSTKTAREGDSVKFKVQENVSLRGHVVIAKDTLVAGHVINAEPSSGRGRPGKLAVTVISTTTTNGQTLKLRAAKGSQGDDKTFSTAWLSSLNPFFLLRKGGEAKLAKGTRITVYVGETKYFRLDGSALVSVDPPPAEVATSLPPAPANPFATVYIYRPNKNAGSAKKPSVFIDDVQLARMEMGSYFVVKLPPGMHVVHLTDKKKRGYEIEMGAGDLYYFRVGVEPGWTGHGKLTLEDAVVGEAEIRKLKFISKGNIKAPDMVGP